MVTVERLCVCSIKKENSPSALFPGDPSNYNNGSGNVLALEYLRTTGRKVVNSAIFPDNLACRGSTRPSSLCLPPAPSSLSLSLLDGAWRSYLPLYTAKPAWLQVQAGKAASAVTICGVQSTPHLHSHPQQPFSLTHALGLFLNDILLPGCWEGGWGGEKKETPSPGFKLKME